jgi:CII-binding regulator of phage lambda lysogenization HflD
MIFNSIEADLIEVLLGIILTFNVGAYSFLWYKIRRVEEKVDSNDNMLMKLFKRIFGIEEDQTDMGHLVETNRQFERMENRFDSLEDKIDIVANENEHAHNELQAMFQDLAAILVDEENVDVDYEDIEEIKR